MDKKYQNLQIYFIPLNSAWLICYLSNFKEIEERLMFSRTNLDLKGIFAHAIEFSMIGLFPIPNFIDIEECLIVGTILVSGGSGEFWMVLGSFRFFRMVSGSSVFD